MYRNLGRSGLKVSPLALGTLNFGATHGCDEADARRMVDRFLDSGHCLIDTADSYNDGASEVVVGRAIKGRRDDVVLATKGFARRGPGPNACGLSRVHLTRALEASLRRLNTDYVDLYQCHGWDAETPIDETMDTLNAFVKSGKVRYLGCSNFTAPAIVEAQWAGSSANGARLVSLQPEYSLVERTIEAEIIPTCTRHGLGLLTYSPLAGGLLGGRFAPGVQPPVDSRLNRARDATWSVSRDWAGLVLSDRNLSIAALVGETARKAGTVDATLAIAWVMRRPAVSAVVVGPRTIAHLDAALAAVTLDVPDVLLDELSAATTPPNRPVTGSMLPLSDQSARGAELH